MILERFRTLDPSENPGVLVVHHGPFAWGSTAEKAVEHAVAIELCAKLAFLTLGMGKVSARIIPALLRRHFSRKHGPKAYYGQK